MNTTNWPMVSMPTELTTERSEPEFFWPLLFLIPIILVSIAGNLMVCIAIASVRKLQNYNTFFLFSLAVADLMVSVLVMPMGLVKDIVGYWILGFPLCRIWITLDVLCCTASILHISIISTDRYLAICRPIHFQQRRRRKSSTISKIAVVWLISSGLSSPLLILGLNTQSELVDDVTCAIQSKQFAIYGSVIAFYFPLLIIVVTYLLTAFTLYQKARTFAKPKVKGNHNRNSRVPDSRKKMPYKSLLQSRNSLQTVASQPTMKDQSSAPKDTNPLRRTRSDNVNYTTPFEGQKQRDGAPAPIHAKLYVNTLRRSTLRSSGNKSNGQVSNERRANQVLFLVFLVFVLSWTPFFVVNVYYALCDNCVAGDALFSALTWVGWASSMINPFIYTAFNEKFRQAFLDILLCRLNVRCKQDKTCCYGVPNSMTNSHSGFRHSHFNKVSHTPSVNYKDVVQIPQDNSQPCDDV